MTNGKTLRLIRPFDARSTCLLDGFLMVHGSVIRISQVAGSDSLSRQPRSTRWSTEILDQS